MMRTSYQVTLTQPNRHNLAQSIKYNFTIDTGHFSLLYQLFYLIENSAPNTSLLFRCYALLISANQWIIQAQRTTTNPTDYLHQESALITGGQYILPLLKMLSVITVDQVLPTLFNKNNLTFVLLEFLIRHKFVNEVASQLYSYFVSHLLYPSLRNAASLSRQNFTLSYPEYKTAPTDIMPIKKSDRYYNYPNEPIWGPFFTTLALLGDGALNTPSRYSPQKLIELLCCPAPTISREYHDADPKLTWIGHACWLIQVSGINILIDPHFGDVGCLFKRYTPPGIKLIDLPPIHFILLSHNHEDHANTEVLPTLSLHRPSVLAGCGSKAWLNSLGFEKVHEFTWWNAIRVSNDATNIKLTAIPAQHGSITHPGNINKMLWCGWVIEVNNKTICFLGDTADGTKLVDRRHRPQHLFRQIQSKFPSIDIALVPIAPDGEEEVHLNHMQAISACQQLAAKIAIPMHWGAHRQEDQRVERPIEVFMRKVADEKLTGLLPVKIGASFTTTQALSRQVPPAALLPAALWENTSPSIPPESRCIIL